MATRFSRSSVLVVLAMAIGVSMILFPVLAESLHAQAPTLPQPKTGRLKPDENVVNSMWPIQNIVSGPAWLMAQGIDPRPWLDRPGWNTLTRQDLSQAETPLSSGDSPVLQSVGPGVLVPFRDPAPAFSRDMLVTRDFSNTPLQTEPHIAVNPRDPDHLLLGVIDYNFPNNSAYVSIDGGVTWDGPMQIKYLREDRISGGDPVVAFDHKGKAYFASISIGVQEYSFGPIVDSAQVSAIQITTSDDGGFTWNEPVSTARSRVNTDDITVDNTGRVRGEIRISFLDKPWMSVGRHPVIEDQEVVYITYTEFDLQYGIFYIGELPILGVPDVETTPRLVRSLDGGVTWSEPVAVGPTVRRSYGEVPDPSESAIAVGTKRTIQGPQPMIGPDGMVYVVWLDSTDDETMKGLGEFYMAQSDDAGDTFGEPVRIATFLEPGFRPRNAFFRYWASAFPKVASGPEGELYVVYTALPPDKSSDEGDIYIIRSLDGGERWSRPLRLNQDDTDSLQFFPAIDVGPDGVVHVIWGDMRDDPVETRYHIYYTTSEDQGETWGFELPDLDLRVGDTRVTDFPSNPNKGFPSGLFLGDYFAVAATEDDAYVVWADTRLGEFGPTNQKIGFSRQRPIPSPEIFISPAAGSGGETITAQGHNFQPDMDVFLQIGGNVIAAGRTDSQGRITTEVFVPISGEGAHQIQLVDESGNFASTSFYMEFGFNNMRDVLDVQQGVQSQLESIDQRLVDLPQDVTASAISPETLLNIEQDLQKIETLELELQQIRELLDQSAEDVDSPEPAPVDEPTSETVSLPTWGLAGLLGLGLGTLLTLIWSSYRNSNQKSQE